MMERNSTRTKNKATPATPDPTGDNSAKRAKTKQPRRTRKVVPKKLERSAWRPTVVTKKVADEIASYIEQGFDYKTSYQAAGISRGTFYKHKTGGEEVLAELEAMYEEALAEGDEDFEVELTDKQELMLYFVRVVGAAQAKAKAANIACLMRNTSATLDPETGEMLSPGDYKAAIEYLRRRAPNEWGDTDKREVTIKTDDATKRAIESGVIQVPSVAVGVTKSEMADYVQSMQRESMQKAKDGAADE